jgi:hypothetical protein
MKIKMKVKDDKTFKSQCTPRLTYLGMLTSRLTMLHTPCCQYHRSYEGLNPGVSLQTVILDGLIWECFRATTLSCSLVAGNSQYHTPISMSLISRRPESIIL